MIDTYVITRKEPLSEPTALFEPHPSSPPLTARSPRTTGV